MSKSPIHAMVTGSRVYRLEEGVRVVLTLDNGETRETVTLNLPGSAAQKITPSVVMAALERTMAERRNPE